MECMAVERPGSNVGSWFPPHRALPLTDAGGDRDEFLLGSAGTAINCSGWQL